MLALDHALLHHPLTPLNTRTASLPTPNAENTSPAPPSLASDASPLATSSGISPVTVRYPGLAKSFNVSDQQALIRQHEDLTLAMQRLHDHQPSFKRFMQAHPDKASQDVTPPNAAQYAAAVQAFWTTPRPTERDPKVLETPLNQLLALHKQQLSTLAALRVSDGTLSAAGKQLIDTALQYPTLAEREAAFADGARPGVYPLTLDDGTEHGALLAGTFLITKTDGSWATKPTWTDARNLILNDANGPVVLYTPGEGFEEFSTPAQARQALAARLDEGGINADLLLQTLPLSLQNRADPPTGEDLTLSVAPLGGDVLAEGITWMLKCQQAEVEASQAKTPLSSSDIDAAADWSYLLDGSNALLARDSKLAEKLQPQWLKNLSHTQEAVFAHLEQAQEESAARLAPLFEQIPSLATFARDRMDQAIKKQYPTAQVDADQLMVQVRTRTHVNNGRKTSSQTPFEKNSRLSLTDLALKNPTAFPAGESATYTQITLTLALTDTQGNPVPGPDGKPVVLDTDSLKALVNTADVGGEYTRLLKKELATDADSGAAGDRRKAWKSHQLAQMEKEAYLAELNPDAFKAEAQDDTTRKRGAQWVTTIMDHPDPASRPQVDGQTLVANTLVQGGLPVQGVMVIGNSKDRERVLYTPNAPDGITFREVPSQEALNTLLNKKEWLLYTANRKSPVGKDDVINAQDALRQYAFDVSRNPVAVIDLATKFLKLTGDTFTLEPMAGNTLDALYKQQVQLLLDKADHQSVSSAEVAEQSRTNKIHFGIEVASIFLDLVPVVGKGVSTGVRLGKAGVTALRANARLLPKLIKNPALGRAIYADFATVGAGIPRVRTAPLRPVAKPPLNVVEPVPLKKPAAPQGVDDIPPAIPSTSRGIVPPATSTSNVIATTRSDLGAYAVPNTVIQGAALRPDGTYNVGDNFYVRFTDSTGENKVYQIDSAFHARNGQVNIVDPNAASTAPKSSRIKASLQSAGNGEWRLSQLPGAGRHRGRIAPPANQQYMDRVLSGAAANDIDGNAATTGQIRRWFRRDMQHFYDDLATNGMPARPSMPVMPINSTPESAIQNTLAQPNVRGLVVGEIHHEPTAYQLVIDQMEELHKSGVTTIYVEGAPFLQGSPNVVHARLRSSHAPYFGLRPYHSDFTGGPTLMDVIDEADLYGIRVIGLEHQQLTWRMDNTVKANLYTDAGGVENRLKEFNYYAAKIIERTPPGEKFVAIVGQAHMNTEYGVPGIAELTGGVGVSISPSLKGGSSLASQPLHTPQPLKLMRGTSVPESYGDIHIDYNIDALTV
ncbi:dermonecrotic toxin domain-containing protein [Pseudomonas cedrina]|uniref:dermonecrotic toxin domain-containing protein n=1 Tax=Pseudomonas cedrina TaxID=651740 RepID=UPI003ED92E95